MRINKIKTYSKCKHTYSGSTSYTVCGNTSADVREPGIHGPWRDSVKKTVKGSMFCGFSVSEDMVEAMKEIDYKLWDE